MLSTSPRQASEMISSTPLRPRWTSYRLRAHADLIRNTPGPKPPSCRHPRPNAAAGRQRTEPSITDRLIADRRDGDFCLGTSGEIQSGIYTTEMARRRTETMSWSPARS